MIWVGSFKPLQSALAKLDFTNAPLDVDTWVRSDIGLISPLVDWLMSLIALSRCVLGSDQKGPNQVDESTNRDFRTIAKYAKPPYNEMLVSGSPAMLGPVA